MNTNPQPRVIAFNYVLKNAQGDILDASQSGQPLPFLEGSHQILPVLEAVLVQMNEGDKKVVKLPAKDAYGEYEAKMIMDVPKEELAHIELQVGSHLQLQLNQGVKIVKVTKMSDTTVTLDGNHPLAGVDLEFNIEIVLIRQATLDEIKHGHAHGLHGTAHHH